MTTNDHRNPHMTHPPHTDSSPSQAPRPTLSCRALFKTHLFTDPPTRVLDGVNLEVSAGEFVVIMGASGSGKSTLLHLISGMDRPSSGQVFLEGRDLTSLSDKEMSRVRLLQMGFVFQQGHFLKNLTIGDNIVLPALKAAPRATGAAIQRVDALMERFGIASVKGHGITEVSGGQLQRASICRALAAEPTVLFADEPTGALNSSMSTSVMDALTGVHRDGTTVVMVTHDPACAARGDRVVYLRDGALIDSTDLGSWSTAQTSAREDELLAWLRDLGF